MKRYEAQSVHAKVYADPKLRLIAWRSGQARRKARAAAEAEEAELLKNRDPERLKKFFESIGVELPAHAFAKEDEETKRRNRLLAMPVAEAWVSMHPPSEQAFNARTRNEQMRLIQEERRRLKAVRRIFKELGIK